jgi:hypothetical protein
LKVEKSKKSWRESKKSQKISGWNFKNRKKFRQNPKNPKKIALIRPVPEQIPARMQQISRNLAADLCGRVAKPTKSQIRPAAAPDPFSFPDYIPQTPILVCQRAPRDKEKKREKKETWKKWQTLPQALPPKARSAT